MKFRDTQNKFNKNFLEIVNAILTDTDGESVATLSGSVLETTKRVCDWVNEGYAYCWKKIFQSTTFKKEGTYLLSQVNIENDYITVNAGDMTEFDNLFIPENRKELKYLTPEEFNRKKYEKKGTPEIYTKLGNILRFKPIPDVNTTLKYYGTSILIPLENDDDIPVVNSDLLIAYGVFKQYCLDYNHIDNDSLFIFNEKLNAEITALRTPELTQQGYYSMKVDESWENCE